MANVMRIGGGSGQPNVLTVAVDTGAIVTATNGDKTVVGTSVGGNAVLKLPKAGTWNLIAELDGNTAEDSIVIVDDYPVEVSFGLPLSGLAVGTLVRVRENGANVSYRIVHQGLPSSMYDESCNGTWVLRETIHSIANVWDSSDNDYENSDMHAYLNGTFFELFSAKTKAAIKQVKIPYHKGKGNSGAIASGGNGLSTKILLLSGYEVGWSKSVNSAFPEDGACLNYFEGTSTADSKRACYYNGSLTAWYLRSPITSDGSRVWCVSPQGDYSVAYNTNSFGVRPAWVFDDTLLVNPTPNADGSYTLIV